MSEKIFFHVDSRFLPDATDIIVELEPTDDNAGVGVTIAQCREIGVYLEVYEGRLQAHVWGEDQRGQDPITIVLAENYAALVASLEAEDV
jgi:hypothetical protein